MTIIKPANKFEPVDVDTLCKVWDQDNTGAQKRQTNKSDALLAEVEALNHCLAKYPRQLFWQHQPISATGTFSGVTSAPFYIFKFDDCVDNARKYIYKILFLPRSSSGTYWAESYQDWGGGVTDSPSYQEYKTSPTFPDDLRMTTFIVERGSVTDTEVIEGLSAYGAMNICDVVVEELPNDYLDEFVHTHSKKMARKGDWILNNQFKDIRDTFRELRTTQLPIVLSWCAQQTGGAFVKGGAGTGSQAGGIRLDNTVSGYVVGEWRNIIDVTDTSMSSRTALTPGSCCRAQYAGVGLETATVGQRVKVHCAVYGDRDTSDAGEAHVLFQGPSSIGANWIDITLGAAEGWHEVVTDFIYLDSTIADTEATASKNKIDVFVKITTAGTQAYVWAVRAWVEFA